MEKAKSCVLAGMAALGPVAAATGTTVVFVNREWPNWFASLSFDWEIMDAYGFTGWSEVEFVEYVQASYEAWDVGCECPTGYTPPCYWQANEESAKWEYW